MFFLIFFLLFSTPALAQGVPDTAIVVTSCGTPPNYYQVGTNTALTQDTTGRLCINTNSSGGGGSSGMVTVVPVDRGGTLSAAGVAQTVAAANSSRKYLIIQNPCTAGGEGIASVEDLFISVMGSATVAGAGNFADLTPCGSATIAYNGTVITNAVTVNAATIGHRWIATEAQ